MAGIQSKAPIQSTAGAIPMKNEKGELYMQKVKVQRYIAGKKPAFAVSDSESGSESEKEYIEENVDITANLFPGRVRPNRRPGVNVKGEVEEYEFDNKAPMENKELTEEELMDPRMKRLLAAKQAIKEEEETISDEEDRVALHKRLRDPELLVGGRDEDDGRMADGEEEEDIDEEEMEKKRELIRQRALLLRQRQEEELARTAPSDSEDDLDFSEEEYSDSEDEMAPRLKPVFVRKRDRVTLTGNKADQRQAQKEADHEAKKAADERRKQALKLLDEQGKREVEEARTVEDACNAIDSDDGNPQEEYETWKVRELKRIKRDREERMKLQKEKDEVERLRNMTELERQEELRKNPKQITNKVPKGKYKFLQKYYHRGAFFVTTEEDEVFRRDFAQPTLEDHFDKTVLPKVMQVKNFGRAGRTKYTHLVDQDTTSYDSPWVTNSLQNLNFHNSKGGGMKENFDRPSANKN